MIRLKCLIAALVTLGVAGVHAGHCKPTYCGIEGVLMRGAIDWQQPVTLASCKQLCLDTPACLSFVFRDGDRCGIFSYAPLDALHPRDDTGIFIWERDCEI
ncbi:hypothetical protein ACJZ2D_016100 [Fusarium nematophilum]